MSRFLRKFIMILAAAMVMTAGFTACSSGSGGSSADADGSLSVVYEGYSHDEDMFMTSSGEMVSSRNYYFVIENTSDQELRSADAIPIGLDENGEELNGDGGVDPRDVHYAIPYLKPGERAFIVTSDADWSQTPASYKLEFSHINWTGGAGEPLSIVDTSEGGGPYTRMVTIRNDGEKDIEWANDPESMTPSSRYPVLLAIVKDNDGNVSSIDWAHIMDGDDIMFDNFTITPQEEKTVEVIIGDPDHDPEFCICWE